MDMSFLEIGPWEVLRSFLYRMSPTYISEKGEETRDRMLSMTFEVLQG